MQMVLALSLDLCVQFPDLPLVPGALRSGDARLHSPIVAGVPDLLAVAEDGKFLEPEVDPDGVAAGGFERTDFHRQIDEPAALRILRERSGAEGLAWFAMYCLTMAKGVPPTVAMKQLFVQSVGTRVRNWENSCRSKRDERALTALTSR